MARALLVALLLAIGGAAAARAELAVATSFNPSQAGSLCGVGSDPVTQDVWVYGCSEAEVERYSAAGAFVTSVPRPGESANDVDVELTPEALTLGATSVPAGSLLFVNGESGTADVYAVDKVTGAVLATLNSAFGASHVVGGAYHSTRNTLFLVQDQVAGVPNGNRIAEVDPSTGAIGTTFSVAGTFVVNFGDLEVCHSSGNLLLASDAEPRLAEFTPTGLFVQYHALPVGVTGLSGIGIDDGTGNIWAASTSGIVWRLTGGPCLPVASIPTLPWIAALLLAAALLGAALCACARACTGARALQMAP